MKKIRQTLTIITLSFIFISLPKCSPDPDNSINLYFIAANSEFQDFLNEMTEDYIYLKPGIDSMDAAEIYHLEYHANAYFETGDTTDFNYCINLFQSHCDVDVSSISSAFLSSTLNLYEDIPSFEYLTEAQVDTLIRICQDLNYLDPEFPWTDVAPVWKDCAIDSLSLCYDQCSHTKKVDKAIVIGSSIATLAGAAFAASTGNEVGAVLGLFRFVHTLVHEGNEVEDAYIQCRDACNSKYIH